MIDNPIFPKPYRIVEVPDRRSIAEDYSDMIKRHYSDYVATLDKNALARTFTLQVTTACNLKCTYCYQINKSQNSMSWETARAAIDQLIDRSYRDDSYINVHNSSGLIVEFIGGEPLLEIGLIQRATDYLVRKLFEMDHPWKNKTRFSICSNGLLYFDERVQSYIKKYNNLLSFSISIDGNKRLHDSCRIDAEGNGSYDRAMRAVHHYRDYYGGYIGSKMTLCPQNIEYLYEAVTSLISESYTDINLNCVYEDGWETKHAAILYDQLKQLAQYLIGSKKTPIRVSIFEERFFHPKEESDVQNWCGGTGSMLAYDYKGDAYPCIRYMESSLGADQIPFSIGSLAHGIGCTDAEKCRLEFLNRIDRKTQSTKECFQCPIAEGCAWCSAYNYQVFGTPDRRATFICQMHQARALANVYYWNLRYLLSANPQDHQKVFYNYVPDEWSLKIIPQTELDTLTQLQRRDLFLKKEELK